MKNSIKILAAFGIVFLMSFSTYAQRDNWAGEWNTKYGKLVITKNGKNSYTGTFPKGILTEAKEYDDRLLGRYITSVKSASLGKKGDCIFYLSADKKTFRGYHMSETDKKYRSEDWEGVRIKSKGDRFFKQ